MARNEQMRARVRRLLSGDAAVDDLNTLFLWLRESACDVATVRELGHFAAHRGRRIKGLVTDEMREFFAFSRFKGAYLNKPFDLADMPAEFPQAARENLHRIGEDLIKRETGLRRKPASVHLDRALSKFERLPNGRYSLTRSLLPNELDVLECMLKFIISRPAFDDIRLFKEFTHALLTNDILERQEISALQKAGPSITLYAVYTMHQTEIALDEEHAGTLQAGTLNDVLAIGGKSKIGEKNIRGEQNLIFTVFETSLKAGDWSDVGSRPTELWESALELVQGPRLVAFR